MWNFGPIRSQSVELNRDRLDADAARAQMRAMASNRTPARDNGVREDGAEARSFAMLVRAYAEILAMVAASTLAGKLMAPAWGTGPIDLLYLPAVLAAACLHGLRPALFGAALSALAYNFFFTAPIHSFRIDRPADLVTVILLFVVATVTSQLAARMRTQARIASANAARNATIAGFARQLLSCSDPEAIGDVACREIATLFECNSVLLRHSDQGPVYHRPAAPGCTADPQRHRRPRPGCSSMANRPAAELGAPIPPIGCLSR